MQIRCDCKKILNVPNEHAGKKVKCPVCGAILRTPVNEPEVPVAQPAEPVAPVAQPVPLAVTVASQPSGQTEATTGKLSGLALATLITGLCSMLCSFFTAIPAFVMGAIVLGRRSSTAKDKKIAVIGMALGAVLGVTTLVLALAMQRAEEKEVKAAHAAYERGDKKAAIAVYRKASISSLSDEEQTTVLSRLADYDAESGDKEAAKGHITQALDRNVPGFSLKSDAGRALLAEVRAERETARAEAARPHGVSKQTYDAIQLGMTKDSITKMLGKPDSVSENDSALRKIEMWHWQEGLTAITVFFHGGIVSDKNWTDL
jgi:DNA-binding XRE family transcriptional regulator/phage FluMu protein Com